MASAALAQPIVNLAQTARSEISLYERHGRGDSAGITYSGCNNRKAASACAQKLQVPRWAIPGLAAEGADGAASTSPIPSGCVAEPPGPASLGDLSCGFVGRRRYTDQVPESAPKARSATPKQRL